MKGGDTMPSKYKCCVRGCDMPVSHKGAMCRYCKMQRKIKK